MFSYLKSSHLKALRSCSNTVRNVVSVTAALPTGKSVNVLTYPGSRILEFSGPSNGNIITTQIIKRLCSKLELYIDSTTVGAVIFASSLDTVFSEGFAVSNDEAQNTDLVSQAFKLTDLIHNFNKEKETITLFNGYMTSSVFSLLASTKYRLGTENTLFRIDLQTQERFVHKARSEVFTDSENDGKAAMSVGPLAMSIARFVSPEMQRYLTISGRYLRADDMLGLGMITHIVDDSRAHRDLADALAHTIPENDNKKAIQTAPIDTASIPDLLSAMHIYHHENDDSRYMHGVASALDGIMSNEAWEKLTLVSPAPIEDAESNTLAPATFSVVRSPASAIGLAQTELIDVEDLIETKDAITKCFGAETVGECRSRLAAAENVGVMWAQQVLKRWDDMSAETIEDIFTLSKSVTAGVQAKISNK